MSALNTITGLDLAGFSRRPDEDVWDDHRGVVLSVHYFGLTPDLPAPLGDPGRLRSGLARFAAVGGAGLVEASVEEVDTLPAVRQVIKVARPDGAGQVFLGSYTVPKAACSVVIKAQAAEGATVGFREAVILGRLGPDRYFQRHPYAPGLEGGLPFHAADSAEWDEHFPDHPLTLVRGTLARIIPTVRLHEGFRALPAFAGDGAPRAGGETGVEAGPERRRGRLLRRSR